MRTKSSLIFILLVVCLLTVTLLSFEKSGVEASTKVEDITVTTERPGEEEASPNIATTTSPESVSTPEKQTQQQVATNKQEQKQVKTKQKYKRNKYWRPVSSYLDPFANLRRMNRMMRSLFHHDEADDTDLYSPFHRGSLWPTLPTNRRARERGDWPALRPASWLKEIDDRFESMIPFQSRFAKIASTVDEQDDKFVFKVVNVPQDLKKENLDIKLTNDGYRDVLDIISNLKTEKETAFFEKRYVFPVAIEREKVMARFDDKERILTVEVPKKPDSATKPLTIKIE